MSRNGAATEVGADVLLGDVTKLGSCPEEGTWFPVELGLAPLSVFGSTNFVMAPGTPGTHCVAGFEVACLRTSFGPVVVHWPFAGLVTCLGLDFIIFVGRPLLDGVSAGCPEIFAGAIARGR